VKNILVAIDDCEATTIDSQLIDQTMQLARAFSSKAWILHIVPSANQAPFDVDRTLLRKAGAAELRREHRALQQLTQALRERGIEASALLVEGPVVRTILRESDRLAIDLIILGCHRHGLLYGALMEFTEQGMLGKCPRPIMFVPVPN
jgi:nucleotide-binding universal stress UspA family protein